jgi:uncharacterized protein DUF4153
VAVGLVLIIARIAFGRSNSWLTTMNFGSLGLALYVCCFINFPALIADYNVTHSRDMKGPGIQLDFDYVVSLGPRAIPAIDRYLDGRKPAPEPWWQTGLRNNLAAMHLDGTRGWRAWTWRNRELAQYLRRAGELRP